MPLPQLTSSQPSAQRQLVAPPGLPFVVDNQRGCEVEVAAGCGVFWGSPWIPWRATFRELGTSDPRLHNVPASVDGDSLSVTIPPRGKEGPGR